MVAQLQKEKEELTQRAKTSGEGPQVRHRSGHVPMSTLVEVQGRSAMGMTWQFSS